METQIDTVPRRLLQSGISFTKRRVMIVRRSTLFIAAWILSCFSAFAQVPSDSEIRKILVERVGLENAGMAIVVGVIDANGRRVVAYGSLARNDKRRLDGDTVFGIGQCDLAAAGHVH